MQIWKKAANYKPQILHDTLSLTILLITMGVLGHFTRTNFSLSLSWEHSIVE